MDVRKANLEAHWVTYEKSEASLLLLGDRCSYDPGIHWRVFRKVDQFQVGFNLQAAVGNGEPFLVEKELRHVLDVDVVAEVVSEWC